MVRVILQGNSQASTANRLDGNLPGHPALTSIIARLFYKCNLAKLRPQTEGTDLFS
jgi:hypothetical protein